jgi:hypothetical protein
MCLIDIGKIEDEDKYIPARRRKLAEAFAARQQAADIAAKTDEKSSADRVEIFDPIKPKI